MAGNQASCKWQRFMDRQRKAENLQTQPDRKPYTLGDECPGSRQRKVEKGENLLHSNITFCSLCCHYNKISLTDEKYTSFSEAITPLI